MSHIFISYSRVDQTYARQLADDLSRRGFDVWIDDQIDFGERWFKVIVQAIEECVAIVVIMSPEAERSEWVEREILVAQREHKPIFPLLLRGREFPLLITTQFADVQGGGLPPESFYTLLGGIISPVIKGPSVTELLPRLFEWVSIPAGKVTLEPGGYLDEETTFKVSAFAIAKYPITNVQYAKFVEASGYLQEAWWTNAGWQVRDKEGWVEPRYWWDRQWNGLDYPVVGVSWFEAAAFCRWLTDATGENVTLPTEQQWQRAAQGDDNRMYPWGNKEPNEWLSNYNENVGHTTSVTQYPAGASPYGVIDMSGNVWEWCQTALKPDQHYLERTDVSILRGGSWNETHKSLLGVSPRASGLPDLRGNGIGFRVCSSAPA